MLRSLRNRLIFSHVLPLFILLPVMGLALAYILETRYILPQITQNLTDSAALLARVSANQPDIWFSPDYAQALLENTVSQTSAQVMLLTPNSRLIASSLPIGTSLVGASLDFPGLSEVQSGRTVRIIHYSPKQQEDAVDIFTPAIAPGGHLVGIVRVTYRAAIFYEEFRQFRGLIAVILVSTLVFGALLGYFLALTISRPIQQATRQIYQVARGELRDPQTEYGPEEVRLLIRAMNFLIEQLNNLEQSRRQLLANLVHELGRPLGAIRSAIQALSKGAGKDEQFLGELTQGMDQETLRLQHLVEELAQLHEQSLGVMELNRLPVNISQWLPTILSPWRQAAAEKRLHWTETIPSSLPPIDVDTSRLGQVMGNLISNAIKYTPIGGKVTISAGADPDSVWMRVSDNGPGVKKEEQERIFNPYYRGEQEHRIRQGMGLGLSIARDLVSAHGGRIEVDSTPGLGSNFTVRLPRTSPPEV